MKKFRNLFFATVILIITINVYINQDKMISKHGSSVHERTSKETTVYNAYQERMENLFSLEELDSKVVTKIISAEQVRAIAFTASLFSEEKLSEEDLANIKFKVISSNALELYMDRIKFSNFLSSEGKYYYKLHFHTNYYNYPTEHLASMKDNIKLYISFYAEDRPLKEYVQQTFQPKKVESNKQ